MGELIERNETSEVASCIDVTSHDHIYVKFLFAVHDVLLGDSNHILGFRCPLFFLSWFRSCAVAPRFCKDVAYASFWFMRPRLYN